MQEIQLFTVPMLRGDPAASTYFFGPAGNPTATGPGNIGVGDGALANVTSGGHNIAIGYRALVNATQPGSNVFIGSFAGEAAINVIDSVAVGFDALKSATTGVGATAVGIKALEHAEAALNNTAIGDSALRYTTTGEQNVAVGYVVADHNVTGSFNVYLGAGAALERTEGDSNVLVGYRAGADAITGGNRNVGVGQAALLVSDGDASVAVGYSALQNATGNENVAVGDQSGHAIGPGTRNTFVGTGAGFAPTQKADAVNSTAIGAGAFTRADNQVVLGNSEISSTVLRGMVGIGAEEPEANIHVISETAETTALFVRTGGLIDAYHLAARYKSRKIGALGDGFASGFGMYVEGADDVEYLTGTVTGIRRDANNVGEIALRPMTPVGLANGLMVRGNVAAVGRYTAPTAGGDSELGFVLTSAMLGIYGGSGAPTIPAAQGSLYLRSDGSGPNNRAYINVDGASTWTALLTAA